MLGQGGQEVKILWLFGWGSYADIPSHPTTLSLFVQMAPPLQTGAACQTAHTARFPLYLSIDKYMCEQQSATKSLKKPSPLCPLAWNRKQGQAHHAAWLILHDRKSPKTTGELDLSSRGWRPSLWWGKVWTIVPSRLATIWASLQWALYLGNGPAHLLLVLGRALCRLGKFVTILPWLWSVRGGRLTLHTPANIGLFIIWPRQA